MKTFEKSWSNLKKLKNIWSIWILRPIENQLNLKNLKKLFKFEHDLSNVQIAFSVSIGPNLSVCGRCRYIILLTHRPQIFKFHIFFYDFMGGGGLGWDSLSCDPGPSFEIWRVDVFLLCKNCDFSFDPLHVFGTCFSFEFEFLNGHKFDLCEKFREFTWGKLVFR